MKKLKQKSRDTVPLNILCINYFTVPNVHFMSLGFLLYLPETVTLSDEFCAIGGSYNINTISVLSPVLVLKVV
jgi:hypothetical protein